jgi:hypothetical protein
MTGLHASASPAERADDAALGENQDRAGLERGEPVLHADVVERSQREAGFRIGAIQVDRGVEHRRPRAMRVSRT